MLYKPCVKQLFIAKLQVVSSCCGYSYVYFQIWLYTVNVKLKMLHGKNKLLDSDFSFFLVFFFFSLLVYYIDYYIIKGSFSQHG